MCKPWLLWAAKPQCQEWVSSKAVEIVDKWPAVLCVAVQTRPPFSRHNSAIDYTCPTRPTAFCDRLGPGFKAQRLCR